MSADLAQALEAVLRPILGEVAVENLQRVTVEGDATSNEWTRFTVAPNSAGKGKNAAQELLTWERVPYTF